MKKTFQVSVGNTLEIIDKLTEEIVYGQLDTKLGNFTEDKLETILKTIKSRKVVDRDEIPTEVLKFDDILFRLCNAM